MNEQLSKAWNLINDLKNENERWGLEKEKLLSEEKYLYGETVLSSSFLSYFGPFDQDFRKMLEQMIKEDISKWEILLKESFKVENILTS